MTDTEASSSVDAAVQRRRNPCVTVDCPELQQAFADNAYMSRAELTALAEVLGKTYRQLDNYWIRNRKKKNLPSRSSLTGYVKPSPIKRSKQDTEVDEAALLDDAEDADGSELSDVASEREEVIASDSSTVFEPPKKKLSARKQARKSPERKRVRPAPKDRAAAPRSPTPAPAVRAHLFPLVQARHASQAASSKIRDYAAALGSSSFIYDTEAEADDADGEAESSDAVTSTRPTKRKRSTKNASDEPIVVTSSANTKRPSPKRKETTVRSDRAKKPAPATGRSTSKNSAKGSVKKAGKASVKARRSQSGQNDDDNCRGPSPATPFCFIRSYKAHSGTGAADRTPVAGSHANIDEAGSAYSPLETRVRVFEVLPATPGISLPYLKRNLLSSASSGNARSSTTILSVSSLSATLERLGRNHADVEVAPPAPAASLVSRYQVSARPLGVTDLARNSTVQNAPVDQAMGQSSTHFPMEALFPFLPDEIGGVALTAEHPEFCRCGKCHDHGFYDQVHHEIVQRSVSLTSVVSNSSQLPMLPNEPPYSATLSSHIFDLESGDLAFEKRQKAEADRFYIDYNLGNKKLEDMPPGLLHARKEMQEWLEGIKAREREKSERKSGGTKTMGVKSRYKTTIGTLPEKTEAEVTMSARKTRGGGAKKAVRGRGAPRGRGKQQSRSVADQVVQVTGQSTTPQASQPLSKHQLPPVPPCSPVFSAEIPYHISTFPSFSTPILQQQLSPGFYSSLPPMPMPAGPPVSVVPDIPLPAVNAPPAPMQTDGGEIQQRKEGQSSLRHPAVAPNVQPAYHLPVLTESLPVETEWLPSIDYNPFIHANNMIGEKAYVESSIPSQQDMAPRYASGYATVSSRGTSVESTSSSSGYSTLPDPEPFSPDFRYAPSGYERLGGLPKNASWIADSDQSICVKQYPTLQIFQHSPVAHAWPLGF